MVFAILVVLGLCFGSFVNALVWRLHEQGPAGKKSKARSQKYSILKGRSMCVHCKHELAAKDLVPLASWLWLRGRCRYCHKSISAQYPLVEAATAALFVISYLYWPQALHGAHIAEFALWLPVLVGLVALTVYDLRWMLLPDKIVFPLMVIAAVQVAIRLFLGITPWDVVLAVVVGGGLFYLLFQFSGGKWIGGGDVKLGFLLGLLAGTPGKSILIIFLAAVLGSLVSLPFVLARRLKRTSTVPFGPFLIIAGIVAVLFGDAIVHWYTQTFLLLG